MDSGAGANFTFETLTPLGRTAPGAAPTIVAISTSTDIEQVAWQAEDGSRRVWRQRWRRGQPRRLLPAALALAGADALRKVQLVLCDVGPGSFTGLRLGLATARALAWMAGASTRPVTSSALLGAAARAAGAKGSLRVLMPSRALHVYDAWLASDSLEAPPEVATVERPLTALLAGWDGPYLPAETTIVLCPELAHLAAPLREASGAAIVIAAPDAALLFGAAEASKNSMDWTGLVPHYVGISEAERAGGGPADHTGLPVERG